MRCVVIACYSINEWIYIGKCCILYGIDEEVKGTTHTTTTTSEEWKEKEIIDFYINQDKL